MQPPIQRNDKCPCNSGRKYKKCCGNEHTKKRDRIAGLVTSFAWATSPGLTEPRLFRHGDILFNGSLITRIHGTPWATT